MDYKDMTPLEQTLKIGLEQAAAGQTVDLGSFAQYAEDSEEAIDRAAGRISFHA